MRKNGKSGKREEAKRPRKVQPRQSTPVQGRDILRFEEHFRIAPKHPGMGRR
jgi:hypothetical protein